MSSQSPSPERTLNRVVRAGVTVANAARRRRTRRRTRRQSPPPSPPTHTYVDTQPTTSSPPSASLSDHILLSNPSSPSSSDPHTRRRNDLRQTLLSFPEHDPSTVAALLNHYHGDRDRVIEKLSQARAEPNPTVQPIPLPQHHRHVPTLTRHHRRPSRRFSREAAAPLWAAAVRTATNSDVGSIASSAYTHPETPRLVGSKRPRRSPIPSDTTDPPLASWRDLQAAPPILATAPNPATVTNASAAGNASVDGTSDQPSDATPSVFSTLAVLTETEPEMVQLLVRRVTDLEAALSRFVDSTDDGRMQVGRRIQYAELEMGALERRHETLEHDLEENRKRVSKTEQYLDTMRRDVRYAIGGREWRFFLIVRQGFNGLAYYMLAYLVPVLFFLARAVRSIVVAIRRRLLQ